MRRFFILCLIMLCAACGWQLRGTVALSSTVENLYLTGEDSFGPLMTELRNRLEAEGVELSDSPIGAQYTLRITRETNQRRVAALGADALASAFELTLTANFDVADNSGQIIAGGLTSLVTRSYNASGGNRTQEEALILGEMRQELAQQILRQLQAVINAAQAQGDKPAPIIDPQDQIPTTLGPADGDERRAPGEAVDGQTP